MEKVSDQSQHHSGCGHGHHHHSFSNNLLIALALNAAFTLIEIVGGLLTNSVAILSDALHDLGDTLSLALAWWMEKLSTSSGPERFTYGYRRLSLVGSLINAIVLVTGSLLMLSFSVPRLFNPEETHAPGMAFLAVLGIAVNLAAVLKLSSGKSENVKTAMWHLLEDVLGWAAVLIGSLIIYFTSWHIIDPILSIGITAFILWNVLKRLSATVSLFLQSSPEGLEVATVIDRLLAINGVAGQHHTHVWSLDGAHHVLTTHLHVVSTDSEELRRIKEEVRLLARELGFYHVTVEIDHDAEHCSMS